MTSAQNSPPQVALYGIGTFGQMTARALREKGWPIVAAYNRAGEKVGQDLGRICGDDKDWGIIVEDSDTADYSALKADVAIMATTDRLEANMPGYERMLGAGVNVICHAAEAYFPSGIDQQLHDQIDALARANGVSFTGTGIWDQSRIWSGILAVGPCINLSSLFHRSITDAGASKYAKICGIDCSLEEFERDIASKPGLIGGFYRTIPQHVLHALGYHITNVEERREPVLFDHPVWCEGLQKDIAPGTAAGTRIIVTIDTAEGVTASAHIELRVLEAEERVHMHWQVTGQPNSEITIYRDDNVDAGFASVGAMVNRVGDIIAAEPGVRLISEMGPLKTSALL